MSDVNAPVDHWLDTGDTNHVVIAVGSFPPPVTGESKNLAAICDDLEERRVNLIRCSVARGSLSYRWLLLPRRAWRYAGAWFAVGRNAGHASKTIYLTSDGGPGLAFTLLTVLIGRLFRYRVFLQHRTFQYIRSHNLLAAAVNRCIGKDGLHVFLSEGMAASFFEKYQPKRPSLINHNLAQNVEFWRAVRKLPRRRPGPELVVGYLSNLMFEKGFDTFLDVARLAVKEGLPCTFVLAGPAPGPAEEAVVRKALAELGPKLEWRGAVHGDAKLRFYRDIDIFMFPTRYRYEAQPNVVLEALCAGAYVIASDIGCIQEDLQVFGGLTPPLKTNFGLDFALMSIKQLMQNREKLYNERTRLENAINVGVSDATQAYNDLLNSLLANHSHSVTLAPSRSTRKGV